MDIVERLRSADPISTQRLAGSAILAEAADEIERLRAALTKIANGNIPDGQDWVDVARAALAGDEQKAPEEP